MIKGANVDIRLLQEKDVEVLRQWRNAYGESFFTHDYITKPQQRQWYSKYLESGGKDMMFIVQLKDRTPIGTIAIYNIDVSTRTADFGRMLILQEYEGFGYAKEATQLVVDFAFKNLKLWKVKLSVFLDNAKAIGIYSECGFTSLTRPVMLMEAINKKQDLWKEPINVPTSIEEEE